MEVLMPGKSTVNGTFSIALFDFRIQKFHVWQVAGENLAYTIHFYANTHKQDPLKAHMIFADFNMFLSVNTSNLLACLIQVLC